MTTTKGLTVHAELDTNTYERGIRIPDRDMKTLEAEGILTATTPTATGSTQSPPATTPKRPPEMPADP